MRNFDDAGNQPTWFAVCTNAKQEDRAYNNLHTWGVECFNPKIKEYRRNQPTPIDNEVIALLQARVDTDGFLRIDEPLKPGDKVRVKSGPWKALVGVVEREQKSNERVMILLDSLKFQSRLIIERYSVEKIS